MLTRVAHTVLLVLILTTAIGCASAEDRAGGLFETAQFEEKQTNLEHASHLYKEILVSYPDTSWAPKAKVRLEVIDRKMQGQN